MSQPPVIDWFEENLGITECSFYGGLYAGAYGAAFASVWSAPLVAVGLGAVAEAAQFTANLAGCNVQVPPAPPEPLPEGLCQEVTVSGKLQFTKTPDPEQPPDSWGWVTVESNVKKIISQEEAFDVCSDQTDRGTKVIFEVVGGGTSNTAACSSNGGRPVYRLIPDEGSECVGDEPKDPKDPIGPDTPYVDPETQCEWTITPTDAYVDEQGIWHTYYQLTSNDPVTCGGPFGYWTDGKGGGDVVNPGPPKDPDDPDGPNPPNPKPPDAPNPPCPDPCPPLPPAVQLPQATYKLTGICELVGANGQQPEFAWEIPQGEGLVALGQRMDALALMLQQHLALKTPTCTNEKPVNEGEWRTISFRSDSVSPFGKSRLRKRFRYRGQQGFGLGEVVDHWKNFTFQSGPVIVQHLGAGWGTPKVWAATADEGKRVIRHASGEAGIDPDQDGRWIISSSDSARLGVSDTMRIDTTGGYYWITARDGSDQRPLVART